MNLQPLFEMQDALDEKIVTEKGLEGQDLLEEKILALQVELGELANDWRGFKYWSENQKPNTFYPCLDCGGSGHNFIENCKECDETGIGGNPMLEEFVDCLHFILSIGNGLKITPVSVMAVKGDHGLTSHILDLFEMVCLFRGGTHEDQEWKYKKLFKNFIGLGDMLGFTWEQIEQAYMDKNKVNHERQQNGY